jgi:pseudaminic acid cytidylyltransferase
MSSLAIIPARGGSKRIPRKNIRLFEGKPMISYSIETALNSKLFEEVMVSTEDYEIAEIARQSGAAVPFLRSIENAQDGAGTVDVLLEVLREYESRNRFFEYGCCIYPTAPLLTAETITQGYQLLLAEGYDSVFPILRYSYPIQRALWMKGGRVTMISPEYYNTLSQNLTAAYHDAGQFYWFRVAAFKGKNHLWTDNSAGLVISEMRGQDIDVAEDWEVAEFKYRYLQAKGIC